MWLMSVKLSYSEFTSGGVGEWTAVCRSTDSTSLDSHVIALLEY